MRVAHSVMNHSAQAADSSESSASSSSAVGGVNLSFRSWRIGVHIRRTASVGDGRASD